MVLLDLLGICYVTTYITYFIPVFQILVWIVVAGGAARVFPPSTASRLGCVCGPPCVTAFQARHLEIAVIRYIICKETHKYL